MKPFKILFTGRHELLDPFITSAVRDHQVVYFHSHRRKQVTLGSAEAIVVHYRTFGLGPLFRWLGLETTTPSYIEDFQARAALAAPTHVITLDFFRVSFLQSLRYVRQRPETKLFIFAETQRWPKNMLSRLVMKFFFWVFKRNLHHITKIFVWTQHGQDFFAQHLPEAGTVLMPASVDTKQFEPRATRQFLIDDTLRIICNARYAPYKRHQDLFAAVAKLKADGKSVSVTCIGRADSGRDRVQRLATECGVADVVTFLDPVPQAELVQLYQVHDVLVLPSYNEAIGMVVPEAMACGIPTVTSDTVGANVYVVPGETGLTYTTRDSAALAECMLQLYDAAYLEQLGDAARLHVSQNFNSIDCYNRFQQALFGRQTLSD
jgi:glycosyltransferase involved in cell wall biosynthesis